MRNREPVDLEMLPILRMLAVVIVVALVMILIYTGIRSLPRYETIASDSSWIFAHLLHIPQFVIPFVLIWYVSRGKLSGYGFRLRTNTPLITHRRMLVLGILVGLLMSLRHISRALTGAAPQIPQPVTFMSVLGHMSFQWIVVGLSEETMFRGLIQTYLMERLRGTVRLLGHELHVGTVITALIWGAFHFINILIMPIGPVIFYVVLTTFAGLAMGYAYQESRSLLTTIIVHNMIFGVPLAIGYLLYWLV